MGIGLVRPRPPVMDPAVWGVRRPANGVPHAIARASMAVGELAPRGPWANEGDMGEMWAVGDVKLTGDSTARGKSTRAGRAKRSTGETGAKVANALAASCSGDKRRDSGMNLCLY